MDVLWLLEHPLFQEHRSVGSATVTGYTLRSDPHTPAVVFPSGLRKAFTRNCGGGWRWGGWGGWLVGHTALPTLLQVGSAGVLARNNMFLEKGRQILPKWKDFVAEHGEVARQTQGRPLCSTTHIAASLAKAESPRAPSSEVASVKPLASCFLGLPSISPEHLMSLVHADRRGYGHVDDALETN